MCKKIIFVRHGKTKDEKLLKDKFKDIAVSIAKFLSTLRNNRKIYFVSSPLERCIDSSQMIITELNTLLNTNYKINIDNKLSRWDKETETREQSYNRAIQYKKQIKKIKNPLIVVISHSSMLPKLIYGCVKDNIKKKDFKEIIKNNKKLNHGFISDVNYNKDFKYNFQYNS